MPAFSGRIKLATFRRNPKYVLLPLFEERHERGIQGGNPWFPFFRHFFVERQRNGIPANTERARLAALGEAVGKVV
jgi:hypothetical protein